MCVCGGGLFSSLYVGFGDAFGTRGALVSKNVWPGCYEHRFPIAVETLGGGDDLSLG